LGARPDVRLVPARRARPPRGGLLPGGRAARRRPPVRQREPVTVLVYDATDAKAYAALVSARRGRARVVACATPAEAAAPVAEAGPRGGRVMGASGSGRAVRGVERVYRLPRLERALGEADFVVLTVPLTEATRGVLGGPALAAMKPTAWLVNIGRGALVDEAALIAALRERRIGGAVLDVFA